MELLWQAIDSAPGKLIVAAALAFLLGWEREKHVRSAGLRTFPLVAVASCAFMLLGLLRFGDNDPAMARVLFGLMTGIGFIGGGAILKQGANVTGTATAASLWVTGAVGAAVALSEYYIASFLAVFTFLTVRLLRPVKRHIDQDRTDEEASGTRESSSTGGESEEKKKT